MLHWKKLTTSWTGKTNHWMPSQYNYVLRWYFSKPNIIFSGSLGKTPSPPSFIWISQIIMNNINYVTPFPITTYLSVGIFTGVGTDDHLSLFSWRCSSIHWWMKSISGELGNYLLLIYDGAPTLKTFRSSRKPTCNFSCLHELVLASL